MKQITINSSSLGCLNFKATYLVDPTIFSSENAKQFLKHFIWMGLEPDYSADLHVEMLKKVTLLLLSNARAKSFGVSPDCVKKSYHRMNLEAYPCIDGSEGVLLKEFHYEFEDFEVEDIMEPSIAETATPSWGETMLVIGPLGSGKTTFAKEHFKSGANVFWRVPGRQINFKDLKGVDGVVVDGCSAEEVNSLLDFSEINGVNLAVAHGNPEKATLVVISADKRATPKDDTVRIVDMEAVNQTTK